MLDSINHMTLDLFEIAFFVCKNAKVLKDIWCMLIWMSLH